MEVTKLITFAEAAQKTKTKLRTLYAARDKGYLRHIQVGSIMLTTEEWVNEWKLTPAYHDRTPKSRQNHNN